MVEIVKRDGRKQAFNKYKIKNAIVKAMNSIGKNSEEDIEMADYIAFGIGLYYMDIDKKEVDIEKIQDTVIETLKLYGYEDVAKAYEEYREKRTLNRNLNNDLVNSVMGILNGENEHALRENANKNSSDSAVQAQLITEELSKSIAKKLIPEDLMKCHEAGLIHLHDLGQYIFPIHNCGLINLKDMFENGTVINGVKIETPKSLNTAMQLLCQLALIISNHQYGGQTISIAHVAPYVRASKEKFIKKYKKYDIDEETKNKLVEEDLKKEIKDSIQLMNYQLLTMNSTQGQAPFISLCLNINEEEEYREEIVLLTEEIFKQRLEGLPNENGMPITQTFPKLIYVLSDNNTYEGSKYFWLTKLACKCTAKRMVPDYVSEKNSREALEGGLWVSMGCRSLLSPLKDEEGNFKSYGRGNVGVVTINLPYVALLSQEQGRNFFDVFDEVLQLCKRATIIRFDKLKGVKASVSPIDWMYGAYARLGAEDEILPYIKKNFTCSIGYAGLYEAVKILTGESHTGNIGHELATMIMKHLDETVKQFKEETGYAFGVYGTPLESTTEKFANKIKERFGEIKEVTDKGYIVNSYHIAPSEQIDAFSKLSIEAEFQKYSLGGSISYIEAPDMSKNLEALMQIIQYIYETNIYAEINIECDYCAECGNYMVANLDDNLEWSCSVCGNRDKDKMNIIRRVCGYVANVKEANKGRLSDIKARVKHI